MIKVCTLASSSAGNSTYVETSHYKILIDLGRTKKYLSEKLSEIGEKIAQDEGLNFLAIDFKKKDGFLKTNKISRELELYRQNYCGCKFSLR